VAAEDLLEVAIAAAAEVAEDRLVVEEDNILSIR
jgi:hypothetical protein